MSYFEDRFNNHAVHATIEKCLEAIKAHEMQDLNEEQVIAISRCEHVVEFAKTMLNHCDADLVNPANLDQLNSAITQVFTHWPQFILNGDWNILTAPCDSLLTHIAQLSSKQRPIPKSYSELLGTLRNKTAEMLRQIREAKRQQDEEADEFETRLKTFAQTLQTHGTEVEKQKTRMDALINEQQETFSNAQNTRTQEFSDFISERSTDCEKTQAEQEARSKELHRQQTQAGREKVDELQVHCDHAKEIVGIIGNIGVTGNYQKIANEEQTAANVFRWIAVGCFAAMLIAVIVVLVGSFNTPKCDWTMALFRVLTAGIFAAPAIYCAMESSKHRKKEQENRKLELELASISPFLEKLNDETKEREILERLAPEYFGNRTIGENGTPLVNIDSKSIEAVLKPVLALAKLLK